VPTADERLDRLERLEDTGEISRIRAAYVRFCDAGFAGEPLDEHDRAAGLAALFTDDGVWGWDDSTGSYRCNGRDAIREFFEGVLLRHRLDDNGLDRALPGSAVHIGGRESIVVTGDSAVAQWSGLNLDSFEARDQAVWTGLHYLANLVRTEDGWRFTSMIADRGFASPFGGPGWIQERLILTNASYLDASDE
jgi:hypothetical protein